jgi:hypothetical protein
MNSFLSLIIIVLFFFCTGCNGIQKRIGNDFRPLAEEDLAVIVQEIKLRSPESLLAKPYFRIKEYSIHPESRVFTHKAVVDFFYMDSILIKQTRKYRYQPSSRLWDRYDKKIHYILDGRG